MSVQPFLLAQQAVATIAGLQVLLRRCTTAAARKRFVMAAWECGAIDRHETGLLITANQLETA